METLTLTAVRQLLADTGHTLDVNDLNDIEELDRVASKVSGTTKGEARLLAEPFELCDTLFYPLTVAKSLWYAEKVAEWELDGSVQEAFLFWLLTIPNRTGELDAFSRYKVAIKAVKRLGRRLHCTDAEMTEMYRQCVGVSLGKGTGKAPSYGGMVECLLREYGGPPERWLYETPLPMIETLMNHYAARVNSDVDKGRAKSASAGKAVAPLATERMKMLRDFRLKVNELKEKWSEQDGEESS